ncbi:MAG: hypothetical protein E7174_04725 [Firmicutes bacterium]|nr:hypothetical protein [Bacillota bacterium]
MKKIRNSTIIAIAIMNLNKKEIGVEDLLDYAKKISSYFKDKGYNVSKIDKTSISNFFKTFPYIGNVKNEKVKISEKISDRMKNFFLCNIEESLSDDIRQNDKYVFPIVKGEELIILSYFVDSEILSSYNEQFYYDSIKNKAHIIDLGVVKENPEYKNIISFLKNESVSKKEILNYKDLSKLFEYNNSNKNEDLKQLLEKFNLSDEVNNISLIYETIFYYCHIANNNKINLEEHKVLVK